MELWEKEYLDAIQTSKKDEAKHQKELKKDFQDRVKQAFKRHRKRLTRGLIRSFLKMMLAVFILSGLFVAISVYMALYARNDELFETIACLYKAVAIGIVVLTSAVSIYRYWNECGILTNRERLKWFLFHWTNDQYKQIDELSVKYQENKQAAKALQEMKVWIETEVAEMMAVGEEESNV